jgi:hypothetical protein
MKEKTITIHGFLDTLLPIFTQKLRFEIEQRQSKYKKHMKVVITQRDIDLIAFKYEELCLWIDCILEETIRRKNDSKTS